MLSTSNAAEPPHQLSLRPLRPRRNSALLRTKCPARYLTYSTLMSTSQSRWVMIRLRVYSTLRLPQVSVEALYYLEAMNSPRADELRSRLDSKFELATIFKSSSEFETHRKRAIGSSFDTDDGEEVPQ
jgi:hypothetical protein